ncbi:hypothetical protein Q8A67_001503 [Cirrhinus molitorella]|uniref:Uncharacterized protein n=1 Tax=Cirrhinus molitorella TaxID=172907 RepID=A0AA88QLG0_9TELE|nr:hypothetical protein Q8A67_001503 [Cirrhinus molitorella]
MMAKIIRRSDSMDSLINFSVEDPDEIDVIPQRKDQIRPVLLGKQDVGEIAQKNSIVSRNKFESSVK